MYGSKMIPFNYTDKYAEPEIRICTEMFLPTQMGWFIVSIFVYINNKKEVLFRHMPWN